MTDIPVARGSIRLHDKVTPSLTAGTYRLRSQLEVHRPAKPDTLLTAPPAHTTHLQVGAPRFTLDASEVAAQHPPRDAVGAFGDRLPHVVLGRRTLPCERPLADGTPWLALMVVRADEANLVTGPLRELVGDPVFTALNSVEQADPNHPVVGLRARDMATFRALLPSRSDVGLLTHVRQVNVADTALAGSDDDGWFAVVTGNRLPLPAATPTTYTACLVSLEARDDVWQTPAEGPPPTLIVLTSWPFVTGTDGGTFEHLAANLDLGAFGAAQSGEPAIVDSDGALALAAIRRDGTPTTVRYRSPLLGTALPSGAGDVTGDAAFELGRLLAAADGRFIRDVVAWHRATDDTARASSAATTREATAAAYTASGPTLLRAVAPAADADPITALTDTFAHRLRSRTYRADLWRAHPGGVTGIPRQPGRQGETS